MQTEHTNWTRIARGVEQYHYDLFIDLFGERYIFGDVVEFFRRYELRDEPQFLKYVQEKAARDVERAAGLEVPLEVYMKENYFLFEFAAFRNKITKAALTKPLDLKKCLKEEKVTDFINKIGLESYQFVLRTDDPDASRLRSQLETLVQQNQKVLSQLNCANLNDVMLYCQQKKCTFAESVSHGSQMIRLKLIGENYEQFMAENEEFVLAVAGTTDLVELYEYCVQQHMKLEEIVLKVRWQVTEGLGLTNITQFDKITTRYKDLLAACVNLQMMTEGQVRSPVQFLALLQTLKINSIQDFIKTAQAELDKAIGAQGEALNKLFTDNAYIIAQIFGKKRPTSLQIYWRLVQQQTNSIQEMINEEKLKRYQRILRSKEQNLEKLRSNYKLVADYFSEDFKILNIRTDSPIKLADNLDGDLIQVLEARENLLLRQSLNFNQQLSNVELRQIWLTLYKSPLVQLEIEQPKPIQLTIDVADLFLDMLIPQIKIIKNLTHLPITAFIERQRRNTWRILGFQADDQEKQYQQFKTFVAKCERILRLMNKYDDCKVLLNDFTDEKLMTLAQKQVDIKKATKLWMRLLVMQYTDLRADHVRTVFINIMDSVKANGIMAGCQFGEQFSQFASRIDDKQLRSLISCILDTCSVAQVGIEGFPTIISTCLADINYLSQIIGELDQITDDEFPASERVATIKQQIDSVTLRGMTSQTTLVYLLQIFDVKPLAMSPLGAAIRFQDTDFVQKSAALNKQINALLSETADFVRQFRRLVGVLQADPQTYQLNNVNHLRRYYKSENGSIEQLRRRYLDRKLQKISPAYKAERKAAKTTGQQEVQNIISAVQMQKVPLRDDEKSEDFAQPALPKKVTFQDAKSDGPQKPQDPNRVSEGAIPLVK